MKERVSPTTKDAPDFNRVWYGWGLKLKGDDERWMKKKNNHFIEDWKK
jgi:hypothetical protein